jgi:hypothetical protein
VYVNAHAASSSGNQSSNAGSVLNAPVAGQSNVNVESPRGSPASGRTQQSASSAEKGARIGPYVVGKTLGVGSTGEFRSF